MMKARNGPVPIEDVKVAVIGPACWTTLSEAQVLIVAWH
jgi:hypothetical protein